MQAVVQLAENIVTAVAVTYNPTSAQQQRAEAVQFLEQVTGDLPIILLSHCYTPQFRSRWLPT